MLSTKLFKFNEVNKKQERILLITNKFVYNIKPRNFIVKVLGSFTIKRKI
jgi:serum/glucocorticoid-regulated kinase 2